MNIADPTGDLPGARTVSQFIQDRFRDARILSGAAAEKTAVLKEIKLGYDIIDFGAHCTVNESEPLYTYRHLRRPEQKGQFQYAALTRSNSRTNQDSAAHLNMYEVFNLDLSHTRLAILAGCETALGKFARGEGLISLQRSFICAGVPALISTLWKVDDYATANIMKNFYIELQKGQTNVAEALRCAQKKEIEALKNNTLLGAPHPYFWAPFIVVGKPVFNGVRHNRLTITETKKEGRKMANGLKPRKKDYLNRTLIQVAVGVLVFDGKIGARVLDSRIGIINFDVAGAPIFPQLIIAFGAAINDPVALTNCIALMMFHLRR